MGKELDVYVEMIRDQYKKLSNSSFSGEVLAIVNFSQGGIRSGRIEIIKSKIKKELSHIKMDS